MKKIVLFSLVFCLVFSTCISADESISVILNGKKLELDVPAQIINGRTMLPLRKILETLGARVTWVETEQGVVATKGNIVVVMKIGSPIMLVSNLDSQKNDKLQLDVPPQIVGNRTLAPIRALSESLGLAVDWDAETRTVSIY